MGLLLFTTWIFILCHLNPNLANAPFAAHAEIFYSKGERLSPAKPKDTKQCPFQSVIAIRYILRDTSGSNTWRLCPVVVRVTGNTRAPDVGPFLQARW